MMRPDEALGSVVLPLAYRLSGRDHIWMLRELVDNESLDEEQLASLQFERLRTLLRHCYANVPYYRALFDELGAQPEDITSLDDYGRLPVLTKRMLKDNVESLIATNFDRGGLHANRTGGSVGEPTQFYQDRTYLEWGSAAFLRNLLWTGYRLGERQVWFWGYRSFERAPLKTKLQRAFLRRWELSPLDLSDKSMEGWEAVVRRVKPRLLYGYASALSAFAAHVERSGRAVEGIHAVMSSSEALLPEQRELVRRVLGASTFGQYGSMEAYAMASECRCGSMHVNSDVNLIEFVALTGETHGTGGRDTVVTPLLSYGMPLLRYVNGDQGAPEQGRCACGLALPRMKLSISRTLDNPVLSDGTVLHSLTLVRQVSGIRGVGRFQFRQTAPDVLELLVVKDHRFDEGTNRVLSELEAELRRALRVRVKVPVIFVDDIPLTSSGKHKYIVSGL